MNNKSFTLIELLVVIVIIGILAGVIMISTSSSIDKANFAKAQAFSSNIQNSMLLNLVAQYELDNDASDSWGNHDGYQVINVTYATGYDGKTNGAGLFNGSAYIRVKDDPAFNFGSRMSTFVWTKGSIMAANEYILGQYDVGTNQRAWLMGFSGSEAFVNVSDDGTYNSGHRKQYRIPISLVLDNDWHHVGFLFNTGILKIYVDGIELNATKTIDDAITTIYNSAADLTVGCYLDGNTPVEFFNGAIDKALIYNSALSSSQIKQNYIAGLKALLSKGSISKEDYNQRINELAYNEYE